MAPTADESDQPGPDMAFKKKLDEKADAKQKQEKERRYGSEGGSANAVVETVTHYVPALGKMLGGQDEQDSQSTEQERPKSSTPPRRPDHDAQIEDFVRDQHRSIKEGNEMV